MSGKELKEILVSSGINLSELARQLGYENNQRLHSALKADDVKTGLLESIAKVINKSVGYFYNEEANNANASENSVAVAGSRNKINTISERFIGLLEKKDEQIDRMLSLMENMQERK